MNADRDGAPRPAWAEIDLDALGRNLRLLRRRVAPSKVLAVVKADAYGHGAIRVGRELAADGVDWLGVALAVEGAALRRAGIETPILVLGPCQAAELDLVRTHRLTPMISAPSQLAAWEEWSTGQDGPLDVHLKVDTGMTRLGFAPAELPAALDAVRRSPVLRLAGLASHLADADVPESDRTVEQAAAFAESLELLTPEERAGVDLHLANSAAALHAPPTRHSLVRLGLALYGLDPLAEPAELEPVMAVRARVSLVREVDSGTRVGYGGQWTARRRSPLAVVPIGYGDGYPFRLWERGEVLIGGRRRPIAGRISMDMTIADVTGHEVALGDEAVLLGRQGDERITAFELAERAGTIPWETLCLFGLRLPRRYLSSR